MPAAGPSFRQPSVPDAPVPGHPLPVQGVLDLAALADPRRCPSCSGRLSGPTCGACRADLTGPAAGQVWDLSQRLLALAAQRQDAVRSLPRVDPGAAERAAAQPFRAPDVPRRPAPRTSAPRPSEISEVLPPPSDPPLSGPPPFRPPAPAPGRRGLTVQAVLVGLGALLLAVATLVFLVRSWDVLGLGARSAVVAALTAAVLAGTARCARPLPTTAQALGALGAVLLLGDAWAVRHTGLLGADSPATLRYWAVACGSVALVLAGLDRLVRVRAWSVAAAVLAPAPVALLGIDLAARSQDPAHAAVGGVGVALLVAAAARVPSLPRVERVVLLAWAAGAAAADAALALLLLVLDRPGAAAVVLGATAAALVALALTGAGRHPAPVPVVWWTGAGAYGALAAVCAGEALRSALAWPGSAAVPLSVTSAGAVLLAARRTPGRAGARGVWAVAAAVAVALAVAELAVVVDAVVPAWQGGALDPVADLVSGTDATRHAAVVLALLAAVAVAAADRLLGASRAVSGMLAVTAPAVLTPAMPVGGAVVLLAVLSALAAAVPGLVAAATGTQVTGRRTALGVAAAVGTSAVVLGWSAQSLTTPALLAGAAGLVLARRAVPTGRTALLVGATASVLVAGAALPFAASGSARVAGAGVAGALLAAVAIGLRRSSRGTTDVERVTVAVTGVVVAVCGVVARLADAAYGPVATPDRLLEALLVAGLVACGVAVAAPHVGRFAEPVTTAAGGALPVVLGLLLAVVRHELPGGAAARPELGTGVAFAVAALLVAAGLAASVLLGREPWVSYCPRRRLGAEAGVVLAGFVAVAAGADPEQLWLVLLLLGGAAGALAAVEDDVRLTWIAVALVTAAVWVRLALSEVDVLEVYTLPVGAVLLVLGLRALGRRPELGSWAALGAGLAVLLVPTLALELTGSRTWRAVWLLVLATALLEAGVVRRLRAPVVLAGSVLAVHVLHLAGPTLAGWYAAQERWLTLALAGALLLALGARYEQRVRDVRAARALLTSLR